MSEAFATARLARLQHTLLRLSRAIDGALREGTGALELTPAQAEAIRFAGTIRPDVATVGQLARVLGVRHTTALGILRPLVDRGLIERQSHPHDARQHILALTEAGRTLLHQLDSAESAVANALAGLVPEDVDALDQGLGSLVRSFAGSGGVVLPAPCRGCVHFAPDSQPGEELPHYCLLIRRFLRDDHTRMPCPEHVSSEPGLQTASA